MQHSIGLITKLRHLTLSQAFSLGEALLLIMVAAPVVRLVPLGRLGRWAALPIRRPADAKRKAVLIEQVAWAVDRAAKRSLFRALCFERGISAQIMLRRRGVDATLFFGARPSGHAKMDAHVWVLVDRIDVTGGSNATSFATLATFPPGRQNEGPPEPRPGLQ